MSAALALPELPETPVQPKPARFGVNEVVLYGLATLILFCPLAFGAVEPWSIFILQAVSAILFIVWLYGQLRSPEPAVLWTPIFRPMLAFLALMCVQLLPGISAYRHATYSTLLLYIAYGVVCFLITQTLTRTTHILRLTTTVIIYGTGMAMFAVLQSLSSSGKLYWIRTPRFGGWIYGPYVNHNHYAGLMEMLVPIPLVFAFSRYAHGRERWAAASAAAFMGATIFLSGSRGGMIAFAVQVAIFLYFLFREKAASRGAFLMAAFLVISLAAIAWIGGSEVTARLSTISGSKHSDLTNDIRFQINRDTLHMFAQRPILGWGLGTFETVYPQFRSFYTNLLVDKAHNDYLQLLAETGVIGFAIMLWFLISVFRPAWPKIRNWPSEVNGAVTLSAVLGITGILIHSLVDFNLEIPANALLFYSLAAVAALPPRFRKSRRDPKHDNHHGKDKVPSHPDEMFV
jgi:O-antigen ligase